MVLAYFKSSRYLYRFKFNGKTSDNELYNSDGTSYDYGFRIYDPRLARFLSVDPLQEDYPELTPYQFASNTPIQAIDLDGLEKININDCMDWTRGSRVNTKPKSHLDIKGLIKNIANAIHQTKPKKSKDEPISAKEDLIKTGKKKQPSGVFFQGDDEKIDPVEVFKKSNLKKDSDEDEVDYKNELKKHGIETGTQDGEIWSVPDNSDIKEIVVSVKEKFRKAFKKELKKQGFDTRKIRFKNPPKGYLYKIEIKVK